MKIKGQRWQFVEALLTKAALIKGRCPTDLDPQGWVRAIEAWVERAIGDMDRCAASVADKDEGATSLSWSENGYLDLFEETTTISIPEYLRAGGGSTWRSGQGCYEKELAAYRGMAGERSGNDAGAKP